MNLRYSIDKAKLEFKFIKKDFLQSFLDRLSYSSISDTHYFSTSLTKCKDNFIITQNKSTFYLGISPNWQSFDTHDCSIILEYNPNKVDPFLCEELQFLLYRKRSTIKILSFDIACDIPVQYKLVRMLKRDIRESFVKIGKTNLETYYLGQIGHNHVKLYDKAAEQKMSVAWTRFEITVKKINSFNCSLSEFNSLINIPILYSISQQIDFEYIKLDSIKRIVLDSIITDTSVLYTIKDYRTRKKYESLLSQVLVPISLDKRQFYNIYLEYFNELFADSHAI